MKYVIFSDIHGNIIALDKMLEDTDGSYDGYIFCGDVFGYYGHPSEVIDRLLTIDHLFAVQGNHDVYYLNGEKTPELVQTYGNSYLSPLTYAQKSFLAALEYRMNMEITDRKISILHGTPGNLLEGRCYPDCKSFDAYSSDITFFGHTHYRMDKMLGNVRIINPGSLGQPRDGQGFSYVVYDFETDECEFRTVEIDKEQLEKDLLSCEDNSDVIQYLLGKI